MSNININNEANLRVQNLRVKKIKGLPEGSPDFLIGVDADGYTSQIAVGDVGGGGGGAGLVDGDYGDVVVSGVGTVMTIDDLAVTTAKIADNAVELGKIQEIGQHKLIGRHSAGDGIPHQIGVTNGIEFAGQDIGIADSGVTQAKLDATGAAAGKVLTTDGTAMTWETPAGGGLTLPIDEIYGGADGTTAMKLQVVGGANSTPSYITAIEANLNGGDGTYGNIALQVANLSGGDTHYPIIIKNGPKISSGAGGAYNEHNYFSVMGYNVHIGGNFGTTYLNILNGIKIDTTDNTIRIHNPADPAQYLDINYNGIPIGDGSVTETKLGDSSVTQAKISATGADVGKVLTTDGTTMTWETPYTGPTGTANNTTRFNASGQLVETNVIAISDAADVIVTGETFDVSLTGGSYIYMDNTSSYLSLQNGDNLDGGGLILSNPGGPNLTYGLDTADSIAGQSVTYLVKLDANTYTGNGSILVGEYDVAEDVPKWGFRNIADYNSPIGTIALAQFGHLSANGIIPAVYKSFLTLASKYVHVNTSASYTLHDRYETPILNLNSPLSNNVYRTSVLFDGTSWLFGSGSGGIKGFQKTANFTTFTHQIQKTVRWFESYNFVHQAYNSNDFAICGGDSGRAMCFCVYKDGIYYDFVPTPLVSGLYSQVVNAPKTIIYQNGVLSAGFFQTATGRYWSDDLGINWTQATNTPTSSQTIHEMANGTLYCYASTAWKYSTDDGKTWINGITLPATPTTNDTNHCIDFNGTNYVFVSEGTNSVYTISTPNSGSWTTRTSAFTTSNPKNVYWCVDRFLALSTASQINAVIWSSDGITWTASNLSIAGAPSFAAKVGTRYFVSGQNATRTEVATTVGGNFSSVTTVVGNNSTKICIKNGSFVIAASTVVRINGTTGVVTTITDTQFPGEYCRWMPSNLGPSLDNIMLHGRIE